MATILTPEKFLHVKEVIRQRCSNLEKEMHGLKIILTKYTEKYVEEVFEASGYSVGDKLTDERGRTWFVSGARELNGRVVLSLNPPKKDGSMSKITFIARGEPRIWLN